MVADIVTAILIVCGGLFAAAAALGMLRMPDMIIRMHASTKAGTLGAGLIFTAVAIQAVDVGLALRAVAALVFLLITGPVATHVIARAAYRRGMKLWRQTVLDELSEYEKKHKPL